MLDLSQRMEVSYKVNKMIKKANDSLGLALRQPHITYKLKNTTVSAQTSGNTINFNAGLVNIITADIQDEVAHIINLALNREHNAKSETYLNILKVLTGNAGLNDIVTSVKPQAPAPKKVVVAKTAKPKASKPVKKVVNGNKAIAMTAYRDAIKANADITRQEMITVIVEALHFENDKPGRIKAAGLYQSAKKALEA